MEFVGVNIWDRNQPALDFLEEFETTYPNGVDEAGSIAIDYGVRGIPEKFFIDQKGVVQQKYVGPMRADALRAAINGLLSAGLSARPEMELSQGCQGGVIADVNRIA